MDDFDDSEDELTDDSEDESDNELSTPKNKISSEARFTRRLTQYYDLIGCYFPVLLRLRELAKLSAISMILKNTHHTLEEEKKKTTVARKDIENMLENIRHQITYPICTENKVSLIVLILNRYTQICNFFAHKDLIMKFFDVNFLKSSHRTKSRSTNYTGKLYVKMVYTTIAKYLGVRRAE